MMMMMMIVADIGDILSPGDKLLPVWTRLWEFNVCVYRTAGGSHGVNVNFTANDKNSIFADYRQHGQSTLVSVHATTHCPHSFIAG